MLFSKLITFSFLATALALPAAHQKRETEPESDVDVDVLAVEAVTRSLGSGFESFLSGGLCLIPQVRQEWRSLNSLQKRLYTNAVNCLQNKPSKLFGEPYSRYEDFSIIHKQQTAYIHQVAHFMPWHRLFLRQFEYALQTECFYLGALPYWDYSIDAKAGNLTNAPVFKADSFGGNGEFKAEGATPGMWGGGCVKDGPFKDWVIKAPKGTTPLSQPGNACLSRNIWEELSFWMLPEREAEIKAETNYLDMVITLEGEPNFEQVGMHGAGHWAIGGFSGSASDVYTSTSDPLFYLHHANLDRIWAEWQEANPNTRTFEVSGPIRPRYPVLLPDASGLPAGNVTLGFEMSVGNTHVQLGQIMNTRGLLQTVPGSSPKKYGVLCYKYAKSPRS